MAALPDANGVSTPAPGDLRPGDAVTIAAGPFAECAAAVLRLSPGERVEVLLEVLERPGSGPASVTGGRRDRLMGPADGGRWRRAIERANVASPERRQRVKSWKTVPPETPALPCCGHSSGRDAATAAGCDGLGRCHRTGARSRGCHLPRAVRRCGRRIIIPCLARGRRNVAPDSGGGHGSPVFR